MPTRLIASLVLVAGLIALVTVWATSGSETADLAVAELADEADRQVDGNGKTNDGAGDVAGTDPVATATAEPFPEPDNFGPRPDLVDIDAWLQTDATSIDDFDGSVLLVEMWTFGCHNCKARIPHNQSYVAEFGDENFQMLGVHAPEFSYEAEFDNIVDALDRLGVTWPQALDTSKKNFRSWQPGTTSYWPRTYVIDQNGDIRLDHIGEGAYGEVRETIRWLLENPPAPSGTAAS